MVSFGGQANDELAVTCTDTSQLTAAYRTVVERYDVAAIDLDIEGSALADAASIERRSVAIAAVQQSRVDDGRDLAVWLTLPVATSGLTPDGLSVIQLGARRRCRADRGQRDDDELQRPGLDRGRHAVGHDRRSRRPPTRSPTSTATSTCRSVRANVGASSVPHR
jgi:hypothetical protein